jgi:para-aminobenzoate synthetase/4-amino-4-deoxychorismate lyase
MKGTAPRGLRADDDEARRFELVNSEKERAENLIIVDLLRNDLGKIATTGSVRVDSLFNAEPFETVWQLTSEISAELREDVGLSEILRALFPCGSVTGAPKSATMDLIRRVEASKRGVYCGAIGVVGPRSEGLRARFNVAIRTVQVDRAAATARYGVGSGVTWGSEVGSEFAELAVKQRVLRQCVSRYDSVEAAR